MCPAEEVPPVTGLGARSVYCIDDDHDGCHSRVCACWCHGGEDDDPDEGPDDLDW
jgi:hypothetical protein